MLNRARGDLVEMADQGLFDVLVHGCNCFKTMGAGIAKQIAAKWPEALTADQACSLDAPSRLGKSTAVIVYNRQGKPFTIVNAYIQYGLGRPGRDVFDYGAFDNILTQLKVDFSPSVRIAFPYIGMGLAGGDPQRIIPMLEEFAETHNVTLVSYTDQKRVAAFNQHHNRRVD